MVNVRLFGARIVQLVRMDLHCEAAVDPAHHLGVRLRRRQREHGEVVLGCATSHSAQLEEVRTFRLTIQDALELLHR